ncbi:squalene synthase HpnC [Streptosporangium sp. NPDC051022]|uniref:squalene synthase HpnC n=1 Tax=Streptosporangium sp. NPDC051022 TaxID=3155752 RepID=UPI00341C06D6
MRPVAGRRFRPPTPLKQRVFQFLTWWRARKGHGRTAGDGRVSAVRKLSLDLPQWISPDGKSAFASPFYGNHELVSLQEECMREILSKANRENFPVGLRLLPRGYREHLLAVYAFVRFVDDIGDEAERGDRLRLLDLVESDLIRLYGGSAPHLAPTRALGRTVEACSIPAEPFHRIVEANRRDQSVTRYATFDDLLGYCELSANPIGHIVLHLFGAADRRRLLLADHVCSALQVIEHCQDVGEDYARGRVYLPEQDLRRFGCTEDDLAARTASPGLRRVVALQTGRAARLLERGRTLTASLTGHARVAVAGYVAGGQATLSALERAGHDVLGHAVRPRRGRWLAAWLRLLAARGGSR